MLGDEIATYLAGAGLGLTLQAGSTTPNVVYGVPFPPEANDTATCVIEYGGEPPLTSFGASLSPGVLIEQPRFQVVSRDRTDAQLACRRLAQSVSTALHHFHGVMSGTSYGYIKAMGPAFFLKFDENQRCLWATNFKALKAVST